MTYYNLYRRNKKKSLMYNFESPNKTIKEKRKKLIIKT